MQYRNVSCWGNTSRYQFRLMVLGEVFFGFDYSTPEEAAFVCDLCKSVLLDAFKLKLDKRVKKSLSDEEFFNRCRQANLNPLAPGSFCISNLLPAKFKEFVERNRNAWVARLKEAPQAGDRDIQYALLSSDPQVKHWAWTYVYYKKQADEFNKLPLEWWRNCLLSATKCRDVLTRLVAPSICKSFSAHDDSPEIIESLNVAEQAMKVATLAIQKLQSQIDAENEKRQSRLDQHKATRPKNI